MNPHFESQLNSLIPPEIKNDEFYRAIQQISRTEDIQTVLEIGSSSGGGSTEAFVFGLRENPKQPTLFCMEVSRPRFLELQKTYARERFVKCYNVSSISLDKFATKEQVIEFYQNTHTSLNLYPLQQVLSWLEQDTQYVVNSGVNVNGIKNIKQENNIEFFDVVLIDGSEFTGKPELDEIYGARFILLDDINTFKNYHNHQKLLNDKNYTLIASNPNVRNGYSIFKKIDNQSHQQALVWEQAEQLLAQKLVKPGMLVFDIGANIGDYSVLLSGLVSTQGRVYAFEPASSTFEKLQARVKNLNLQNISLLQKIVFSRHQEVIEFNEFSEDYSAWNSIGKPQMLDPRTGKEYVPIVKTEQIETVSLDSFCQEHGIEKIDYLKLDVEGAESDVLQGAIQLLERKAIRFIQFEISQKMLEGLNRQAEDTFQLLAQYDYECHRIQSDGHIGEQVANSNSFYENYIAFPKLPIHFFTIVLNGQPFIRYHIDVLKQLPCEWHWHIIEGVADLRHDTAWSLQLGGRVTDELHQDGWSKDGTKEYLDELALEYPENVSIYRKPKGVFWDGKLEMVNAPLANIDEECLLWQIDVDELWTPEQIIQVRSMFIEHPEKTAAFYWCSYFVGENLVVSTRYCYSQNPQQEWLRTWRFQPGYQWAAHEPPVLVAPLSEEKWQNLAAINPFSHQETEAAGLVFQHFAYVTPEQLSFKEDYYGYKNASAQWRTLQEQTQFPVFLRDYFPWVEDATMVNRADSCGIIPIAQKSNKTDAWYFLKSEELEGQLAHLEQPKPKIIIDGVFFQLYKSGIGRVWRSLLEEWVETGFAKHLLVLDRLQTTPIIPGVKYRSIPLYDYDDPDSDRQLLQQVCDEESADLFISTYYTTPISTPSVLMVHDMIPEVAGTDLNQPLWKEKHYSIRHASAYLAVSENTARDLVRFFPDIDPATITVTRNGVGRSFTPRACKAVHEFKHKYSISKPYFLISGARRGYKNTIVFFQAFSQLISKQGFDIVCTGVNTHLETEFRAYAAGATVHMLHLDDDELPLAYAGAIALVYPSQYEGFGLPIIEAMACGCPVITAPNASIPEVAGQAALFVESNDINGLTNALCEVQKPEIRRSLIQAGLEQAKQFSWAKMAQQVSSALIAATLIPLNLSDRNLIIFPDWSQPEEIYCEELANVIQAIAPHQNKSQLTLLIHIGSISQEDANLILSSITMTLLLEEGLEVNDDSKISLVSSLHPLQWQALLTRIQGRIILPHEDQNVIAQVETTQLPTLNVEQLTSL